MDRILRLKHWQLFLLVIAGPVSVPLLTFLLYVMGEAGFPGLLFVMVFALLISHCSLLCWFYQTGMVLSRYVPANVSLPVRRFQGRVLYAVIYTTALAVWIMAGSLELIEQRLNDPAPLLMVIIVPLHLFAMFCLLYGLYFNAKALKTVEEQRELSFSEFSGEFFLMWFFPIGIWIIQPRINAIVEQPPADPYSNMDIFQRETPY